MEEEENRDVVDEGGTVISRSSIVVNCNRKCRLCMCKSICKFDRLIWQIVPIDCNESVSWVFQRKRLKSLFFCKCFPNSTED